MDEHVTDQAWLENASGAKSPIRGACSIGRGLGNDIVLADERVSRRHAMIHSQAPGEFWLVDLHSANGTHVNGRRLRRSIRLKDQDHIELGSESYVFRQHQTTQVAQSDRSTEKTIQDIKTLICWLLVADIEGYTRMLQQLSPEDVASLTGEWLNTCREIVEENKGITSKFLGDGFLAYWLSENDATTAAVASAVHSMKRLQPQKSPPFRVVVHHGKVFRGGGSPGEENLMGSEVNFTFRMEKLAKTFSASCLLSEAARTAFGEAVPAQHAGRCAVPSFEGEFDFYLA